VQGGCKEAVTESEPIADVVHIMLNGRVVHSVREKSLCLSSTYIPGLIQRFTMTISIPLLNMNHLQVVRCI
jgi:hypothetical protein